MNKRILIVIAILVAFLCLVLALPYYLGVKTEQSLQKQQALLAKASFLNVEKHTYDRGWFSSTETTILRFKPDFLGGVQQKLPDNVRTVLQQPIVVINHIHHGLFTGGFKPVRAQINTEFQFTPETRQILARFFGSQTPIIMHNTIELSGNGEMQINIPKFNYEELSGIKLNWEGLQSNISYTADFMNYNSKMVSPGLNLILADKGSVSYQGLSIDTSSENSNKTALSFGNSQLNLKQLSLQWQQGVGNDVRLNDLFNLVSDLQVGAFINPHNSVPPSQIMVQDLYFKTSMNEEDDKWIKSKGQLGFAKLLFGKDSYGPLTIDASAEHLDAQSLLALKNKLHQLATQNLSNEQLTAAIIEAARNEGLGLFTHDPLIKINTFKLHMPQGIVDIHGSFGLKNLQGSDMQQFGTMAAKIQSQMHIEIPQAILEDLAISQARSLFTVDPSINNEETLADIDQTIRLMIDSSIRVMVQQGYLTVQNGILKTEVQINNGKLLLNNKPLAAEPEQDDWDESLGSSEGGSDSALSSQKIN